MFEGMFVQMTSNLFSTQRTPGCKPTLRNFLGWENYGKVIGTIEQLKQQRKCIKFADLFDKLKKLYICV